MTKEIVLALIFAALSQQTHAQVLARVGNKNITLQYFNERYTEVKRQTINPPAPQAFLNDLIRFEMGVQEAKRRHLENDPEIREAINKDLYKGLLDKVLGQKIQQIQVTDAEMRNYYEKNPEIRSSHILIEFKPDAPPEQVAAARKRAYEIYNAVKKSRRPFADLVKLYSDDTLSKPAGGDIGYQNRITVVPTYYDALLRLKLNQISPPVRTQYGFHIIKMTGRLSYHDANKTQIRAAVFDEKRKVFFDEFFKTLVPRYRVTKNEKLVKSLR